MSSFWSTVRISFHFSAIDLRRRWFDYAANILGPYIAAAVITIFFGAILKGYLQGYADYARHVVIGIIVWSYVSSTTVEGSAVLSRWPLIVRYSDVPLLAVAMSIVWRHSVYFAINLLLALSLLIAFMDFSLDWPAWIQLAAAAIAIVVLCHGLTVVAMVCGGRFRGMNQILVGSFNVAFLLTPILWKENFAGRFEFVVKLNPFRHLVEIVRGPVSEGGIDFQAWAVAILVLSATVGLAIWLWRRYEPEVRYWI